jgi:methionyl-tRNA synthetase
VSRFYLTTAIDYVNSRPHLGTAYEKITADVIARYKRLCGLDVHFLMGNDEHSQNVYKRAVEQGFQNNPVGYCDRMEEEFTSIWKALDCSYDDFIRTTQPRHKAAVQKMAQACYDAGDIYEGVYEGWYCVSCEAFKPEKDLVDGKCPQHPTLTPEWIREKNYFFRLSKYQDRLKRHFEAHPEFLEPEIRRNEILRLLDAGLEDISMSRAGQSWGVPLPFDPDSVVYVWFDALINYATAVGYGTDDARLAQWWPADLHVIGKDITRFHTVVWPAMLWSAGLEAPRQVFGHGWLHYGGQRLSKSLGTSVDPLEAAQKFGKDAIRLYLTKEISYGGDGDFTWERFEERYNVDLANNLGNLVSRVISMADKYRGGRIVAAGDGGRLADVASTALERYRASMDAFAMHDGMAAAFQVVDAANVFIADSAPWKLAKDPANAARLDAVLFEAAEAVRVAAVLLRPVMPSSCDEILRRIGAPVTGSQLRLDHARWTPSGERVTVQGPPMWPRAEPSPQTTSGAEQASVKSTRKEKVVSDSSQTAEGQAAPAPVASAAPAPVAAAAAPAAADARIGIEDFLKVELKVAKVREAAAMPKSKKLIRLLVDVGEPEPRTILAGIAEGYTPEQLVGRTIVIVANLKPRPMMGTESNGMVLAASAEGQPPILVAADDSLPPGTRVG